MSKPDAGCNLSRIEYSLERIADTLEELLQIIENDMEAQTLLEAKAWSEENDDKDE